eukprot:TRINITY_DN43566_c0_g1_i1.p1 TRINITY_DN43566_c0_g1~~TRINITY_DN43566_c0_g1_i1.p1  ORF type:complete len:366 (+),score=109.13 TRINITY_DN43566_c0_g1_i1:64-1161(+)
MSRPSTAGSLSRGAADAQRQWSDANSVRVTDEYYKYDKAQAKALLKQRPWKGDAKYFKEVKMSALSLVKIVMHAKTGKGRRGALAGKDNWLEVMGCLQGYVMNNTFVILDSFALPVEGSEVEVVLSQASSEYMVNYFTHAERIGKVENAVGWYHSHPGYSCFLSGIDVETQTVNQVHQDPYLALVVDPVRTISTGKVEIKAFRTYPKDYQPEDATPTEWQAIPQDRIEDFGVHANRYYEVPIEIFKSSADQEALDLLWNKYWGKTLSTSVLTANRFYTDMQVADVAEKLERVEHELGQTGRVMTGLTQVGLVQSGGGGKKARDASDFQNATMDAERLSHEVLHGLLGMVVKDAIFNGRRRPASSE